MHVLYLYTVLQIIFESLPVSSSGNVFLWIPILQNVFSLAPLAYIPPDFDFILHIPTLFVLGFFFFPQLAPFVKSFGTHRYTLLFFITRFALADAVTVCFYYAFKSTGTTLFPLWIGFLVTSALLFSLRFISMPKMYKTLTYQDAAVLGAIQGCALLPGISRLAATYVGAIYLRYTPWQAFRYSFLLHTPLIGAAILKGLYSVISSGRYEPFLDWPFYLVIIGASYVAFCLLSVLSGMVTRNTVWKFGWYVLLLAALAKVCHV